MEHIASILEQIRLMEWWHFVCLGLLAGGVIYGLWRLKRQKRL